MAITGDLHKENTVKTDNWENMSVWKGNCPTCGGGITLSSEIPIPEEKVRIKTVREAREEILQISGANGPMNIVTSENLVMDSILIGPFASNI